jgi:FecR protein/Glucodextranase, domain B
VGRSIVIVVVIGAALLAVALLVYRTVLGDDDTTVVLPARADAGPNRPLQPDPLTPGADAGVVVARAELTTARGAVQARGADGKWRDVAAGELLNADDGVRTGRNAEAVLRMGDGVEVRLSPRSEFTVRELSAEVSKIRLEEGHVTATVNEDGKRVLKVAARGTDAEATSAGGQFGVVTDGKGQLAVATTTGSVNLTADGQTVEVKSGETSTVTAEGGPSAPRAIPASLFLKVGAATQKTNQLTTTVSGTTDPGALVRVQDATATADDKGRFSMKVPLKDGKNALAVDVTDASGRTRTEALPEVMVDRVKPEIEAETQWGAPK